ELRRRGGSVFLVRRSPAASLMPGMWELPQCALSSAAEDLLTLRHSITHTAYVVRVKRGPAGKRASGKWVATSQLEVLPLTGLARKILRAVGVTDPES
ncbi:MAG TPA: A/G-specific adenine glycosylase, partial [Terriglobales bacterium]